MVMTSYECEYLFADYFFLYLLLSLQLMIIKKRNVLTVVLRLQEISVWNVELKNQKHLWQNSVLIVELKQIQMQNFVLNVEHNYKI